MVRKENRQRCQPFKGALLMVVSPYLLLYYKLCISKLLLLIIMTCLWIFEADKVILDERMFHAQVYYLYNSIPGWNPSEIYQEALLCLFYMK